MTVSAVIGDNGNNSHKNAIGFSVINIPGGEAGGSGGKEGTGGEGGIGGGDAREIVD